MQPEQLEAAHLGGAVEAYFDSTVSRTDHAGHPSERLWDFLERSSWGKSEVRRQELTALLNRVPEAHRDQFVARLRSDDLRGVQAAYTELVVYALLELMGHACELDPITPGGSRTDLRLASGTHIEIHRPGSSDSSMASGRRRDQVLRGLDAVQSPDFLLSVDVSVSGTPPSVRRIRREIEQWVASLDWATERARWEAGHYWDDAPTRSWTIDSSTVTLQALPRSSSHRGGSHAVGISTGEPPSMPGIDDIIKDIRAKTAQHKSLEADLIVVLDLTEGVTYDDEIAAALYGPMVDHVDAQPRYTARDRTSGIWRAQGARRNPVAVLTIDNLRIGAATEAKFTIWLQPEMPNRLADGPWSVISLGTDGELEVLPSVTVFPTLV